MINILSALNVQGILTIHRVYEDRQELVFSEENLVTLTAKQALLSTLYLSGSTSLDPISYLKVGTGGTIDPQGLFPKLEDATQTDLHTPLLNVSVTHTVDNTIPAVTFIADLDTGTGNGQLISEAGLFRVSNTIFNVKNFPAVPKSSDFGLHFSWTVKFA